VATQLRVIGHSARPRGEGNAAPGATQRTLGSRVHDTIPDTATDAVRRPLGPGDIVDRYRIERMIAAGGMARVYRAVHMFTGAVVALKVMRTRYAQRPDLIQRFRKEAVALSHIRHSNVVTIENGGVTDAGEVFIAMELLEGRTLREILVERGRLPARDALSLVCQVAQGVSAAHDVNVIHRDLKPENIFCTVDGAVKVLDLGLAKFIGHDLKETDPGPAPIGTAAYISPERLQGKPGDARGDIYSLGLIAYECLAGWHPLVPEGVWPSKDEVALRQLTYEPEPLRGYPPELWAAVACAIDKDPERRYASMDELVAVLHRVRHELHPKQRGSLGSGAADRVAQAELERRQQGQLGARVAGPTVHAQPARRQADNLAFAAGRAPGSSRKRRRRRGLWAQLPKVYLAFGGALGLLVAVTGFLWERHVSRADAARLAPTSSNRSVVAVSDAPAVAAELAAALPVREPAPELAADLPKPAHSVAAAELGAPASTPSRPTAAGRAEPDLDAPLSNIETLGPTPAGKPGHARPKPEPARPASRAVRGRPASRAVPARRHSRPAAVVGARQALPAAAREAPAEPPPPGTRLRNLPRSGL
jgi:tRNA A-37 threonylcarbamoyl transferase component Bud32